MWLYVNIIKNKHYENKQLNFTCDFHIIGLFIQLFFNIYLGDTSLKSWMTEMF